MARQVSKKRTKPVTKGTKKTITKAAKNLGIKRRKAIEPKSVPYAKNELLNVPVSAELYDALNDARPVGMPIGEFALSSAGQAVVKRYNEFIDECAGDSALHDQVHPVINITVAAGQEIRLTVPRELYEGLQDLRNRGSSTYMSVSAFASSPTGRGYIRRHYPKIDERLNDQIARLVKTQDDVKPADPKIKVSSPYGFNITGPWQNEVVRPALADGHADHGGPDRDDVFNGKQSAEASDILGAASIHLRNRAAQRDQPDGERSMTRAVHAFNALFRRDLTEREGWMFMVFLKAARATNTQTGILDDYQDGAAYFALAGEAAMKGSEG